ncbi:phage baseplate assembly protein V [Cellvibrio japonicus]|nr:phage baseplate assembly protein V [Cellvibrio japonicus]
MSLVNPHSLGQMHSLQLGQVMDNADPDHRGRIKVLLHANQLELWASVVVPSAGSGYGLACLPRVGELVVLAFITPELPMVLGSVWSGHNSAPEEADAVEDRYIVKTPAGTILDFNDQDGPSVSLTTPQGYSITITDGSGGEIAIERQGQSVKLTSSEVNITSSATVAVNASRVTISASMVQVDAGMSRFSGVVQADTVIANAVVGTSYTPGAGNIW